MLETGSKVIFLADLWAEIYNYLFWRPYWPSSWQIARDGYFCYRGSIARPWYFRNRLFVCLCS